MIVFGCIYYNGDNHKIEMGLLIRGREIVRRWEVGEMWGNRRKGNCSEGGINSFGWTGLGGAIMLLSGFKSK